MGPDAVARLHVDALRSKVFRLLQQLCRHDAVAHNELAVVDVVDEMIERGHPLLEAGFDPPPLGGVDDAGNDVEGPFPVDIAAFRIHRKRDAHHANRELGGFAALTQFLVRQAGKMLTQCPGRRTDTTGTADQLIVELSGRIIFPIYRHERISFWNSSCSTGTAVTLSSPSRADAPPLPVLLIKN